MKPEHFPCQTFEKLKNQNKKTKKGFQISEKREIGYMHKNHVVCVKYFHKNRAASVPLTKY